MVDVEYQVMALAKDFKDLDVYQNAFESSMEIFNLTKTFPVEERYALVDQIRRSSRSVCANIAEAWYKRRYPAAFVSKLSDADAEAAETIVWLDYALKCTYVAENDHASLMDRYTHICAQLTKMMSSPEKWFKGKNASKTT